MAPKSNDKPVELTAETESKKAADNGKNKANDKKKSKKNDNPDIVEDDNAMSEEDRELKERLETCVSTLINEKSEASVTTQIRLKALDVIVTELRSATSSMTSVPKPLKFLRPKYETLKEYYGTIGESTDKDVVFLRARLGDVLAVLAMTLGKHGEWILYLLLTRRCTCTAYLHLYIYLYIYSKHMHRVHLQTREKASISNSKEPKIMNHLPKWATPLPPQMTTSDHGGMNSSDPSPVKLDKSITHV